MITTIPASSIEGVELGDTEFENPERFWGMHNSSKEFFSGAASHIPEVQTCLSEGKSLDEIREQPDLKDCVNIFFDPNNAVRVIQGEGYYRMVDDGRHRVMIAKEYDYNIPVRVIGYEFM